MCASAHARMHRPASAGAAIRSSLCSADASQCYAARSSRVVLFVCVRASVSYRVLIGGDFLTSEDLLAVGDLYRRLVRPELVRERANAVRACAQPLARVRLRAAVPLGTRPVSAGREVLLALDRKDYERLARLPQPDGP